MADDNGFEGANVRPRRSRNSDGGSGGTTSEPASLIDPGSLASDGDLAAGRIGDGGDDGYVRDEHGNVKRNKDGSPRKRKRPRGSAAKAQTPYDLNASIAMMGSIVHALHSGAAIMLKTPELETNKQEDELLANAIVPLMAHYHVTPPPEVVLWSNLFTALAIVEGPRYAFMRFKAAEQRANNAKPIYPSTAPEQAPNQGPQAQSYTGGEAPAPGSIN